MRTHPSFVEGVISISPTKTTLTFANQILFHVHKDFYSFLGTQNYTQMYSPVIVKRSLIGVSDNRMCHEATFESLNEQKCLLRYRNYAVVVDKATRKPHNIHSDTAGNPAFGEAKANWKFVHKPNLTFTNKVTIRYSDLDENNHCNVTVFIRHCIDCASLAYSRNQLKFFSHDVCFYKLKSVLVRFRREALVHNEITVHGWQEWASRDAIYFQIFRDDELLTQCKVAFHMDVSKL